ncbi:hypothetical protein SAMN04488543_2566 [Friedmanniella luteola]|uniref:Uncharacterized protein n=1 Tax=Friedmanniella luteola TaxID=546871 RepID=A0A1H1VT05_9ACTN|nr:hypothetical protein SAMN04488543_2566 [Friedmanniella luteola]
MVYVPLPLSRARALRDGEPLDAVAGHAATPSLRRALDLAPDDEEGDYAALNAAGVAALAGLAGARRLVLAAEVPDDRVVDGRGPSGEVDVADLRWPQVRSLFADEEVAGPAVAAAAAAVTGTDPAQAYDLPAVVALTDGHDLLWFAPEELDALG